MMQFGDTTRLGRPYAKDPAVVRMGGRYLMYHSIPPYGDGRAGDGWAMGIAASTDLVHWQTVGSILPAAPYEAKGLCAPGALVIRGQVHLFYQTYGNGPLDRLCHAVSDDGIHFRRDPSNPIFHPTGDWNSGRAIDADVVAYRDKLWLYFATRDPQMQVQMLGVAAAPLGSDFGRSAWTQMVEGPILKPQLPWEKQCIEAPALLAFPDRLVMFYAGAYNLEPQQIGVAQSADGIHWQRLGDQPILPHGSPGQWNHCESGHPFAFRDEDGQDYLFFQGNPDMGHTWLISCKRIEWHGHLPVLHEVSPIHEPAIRITSQRPIAAATW
jgi:sucrose-6-phosphate hydrolase SacC (GH32 family)